MTLDEKLLVPKVVFLEIQREFVDKFFDAWDARLLDKCFLYGKIALLMKEKISGLPQLGEKYLSSMKKLNDMVIGLGKVIEPAELAKLNEMAMEIFKGIEAGVEEGVEPFGI